MADARKVMALATVRSRAGRPCLGGTSAAAETPAEKSALP